MARRRGTVRDRKVVTPILWVPPIHSANYAITVTRADGTVDTITNRVVAYEIVDGINETIGTFKFDIWNPDQSLTGIWVGDEVFSFFNDYTSPATTLRFRGRLEKVSSKGHKLEVRGRGEAVKLKDVTVTQTFTDTATSEIIKSLLDTYGENRFTQDEIQSSTKVVSLSWSQKPFWEVISELAVIEGFGFYIDANLNFHYFPRKSRVNSTEGMVHEFNITDIGDFTDDISLKRNRIIVYGAIDENTQVLYTAEDEDSLSRGVKELIINDTSIVSFAQAQTMGDAKLAEFSVPQIVGEVTSIMLATIQPGETIRISAPEDNIPPGKYEVVQYTQTYNQQGLFTKAVIDREPTKLFHSIKGVLSKIIDQEQTSTNPEEMRFAFNTIFSSDQGTHSNTEVTSGILRLQTGQSDGTWTSASRTTPTNVESVYLILNGSILTGAVVSVSADGNVTFQPLNQKEFTTLSFTGGKTLSYKIVLDDNSTQVKSISLLYKLAAL